MKRSLAVGILSLMLAGLQYRLWIDDGGVYDSSQQRGAVAQREQENSKLRLRNDALQAEVDDLRAGGAAIEAHARNSLGMVRREETFYLVVNAGAVNAGSP